MEANVNVVPTVPGVMEIKEGDSAKNSQIAPKEKENKHSSKKEKANKKGSQAGATFTVNSDGLYYCSGESESWIASSLEVKALSHDEDSHRWGVYISYLDPNGAKHMTYVPFSLIASPIELKKFLVDLGIKISSDRNALSLLVQYLNQRDPNLPKVILADTCGWHGGSASFVMPNRTIGKQTYRLADDVEGYTSKGTPEQWKNAISKFAVGNSRLVWSICASLAGPILGLLKRESIGIHLVGGSSEGKTTAGVYVAGSCLGDPDKVKSTWQSTRSGMEGKVVERNHLFVILDEMNQMDAHDIANVIYTIMNGQGKSRARKDGKAQRSLQWTVVVISTGEIFLADHVASAGQKYHAGLDVRLIQIRADTGMGFGIFENLHGFASGAAFASYLNQAAKENYGTAVPTFIRKLIENEGTREESLKKYEQQFLKLIEYDDLGRQEKRVAGHFAILAATGELATAYGITGWPEGEAITAAQRCFSDWRSTRPKGELEDSQILSAVRQYIQESGDSAFVSCKNAASGDGEVQTVENGSKPIVKVGFKKESNGQTTWLVYPQSFKTRICPGFDEKRVFNLLASRGWLLKDKDHNTKLERIPSAQGPIRMIVLTSKVLSDDL